MRLDSIDPTATLTLATYGVMGGLGLALRSHASSRTLGSAVLVAAGIGVAFTVASVAAQRLVKAPSPVVQAPVL